MQNNNHNFYGLGIAPKLLEILDRLKFTVPTPIQYQAIPIALEGSDIMGIAQTGTGKTLAFSLPIVQRLSQLKGNALILAPTRELALQINETFKKIGPPFGIRTAVLIGGASFHEQLQEIRRHPRVVIATPGRLLDHVEQRSLKLSEMNILVLDEADRMLDMGFAPQIRQIMQHIPKKDRQTMLFSATMPQEIVSLASTYMHLPTRVEIVRAGTVAEKVTQELFIVPKEMKKTLLGKILKQYHGTVLMFCRTKHGASNIRRVVREMGHQAAEIHSDRSLGQRREALEGFKKGKYRVLVATDIAARGIDVSGIELVLNYDLPDDAENYVHRIGRTGRAGQPGHSISFATPDQRGNVRDIEKVINTTLPVSEHPEVTSAKFSKPQTFSFSGRYGGRRRR